MKFIFINSFKGYSPNRQTDRQTHTHYENITSIAYAGMPFSQSPAIHLSTETCYDIGIIQTQRLSQPGLPCASLRSYTSKRPRK